MSQPDAPKPEREQDQRAEHHRGSGESPVCVTSADVFVCGDRADSW